MTFFYNDDSKIYFIYSGLASLVDSTYLIRDYNSKDESIHIFNDSIGDTKNGFIYRS
ncbi:oleate hydratase [Clostridium perfringens]|nr:oleate hydratase [Clostridium perfringens]